MEHYRRYAIYAAPEGALWDWASRWLGWDALRGEGVPHPAVDSLPRPLAEITEAPRKYGFHATVKPPFRLAEGATARDLDWAAGALCLRMARAQSAGLKLARLGGFLALVPEGDDTAITAMAAQVVEALDAFRAPPDAAEIARRRPERLTERQRAYLDRWGYPYVMDEFHLHLTLTGDLPPDEAAAVETVLAPLVAPLLPRPFVIDSLCLFGEAQDGRFHLLHRYALSG
jgi:putative phosphonate metabolism protein